MATVDLNEMAEVLLTLEDPTFDDLDVDLSTALFNRNTGEFERYSMAEVELVDTVVAPDDLDDGTGDYLAVMSLCGALGANRLVALPSRFDVHMSVAHAMKEFVDELDDRGLAARLGLILNGVRVDEVFHRAVMSAERHQQWFAVLRSHLQRLGRLWAEQHQLETRSND